MKKLAVLMLTLAFTLSGVALLAPINSKGDDKKDAKDTKEAKASTDKKAVADDKKAVADDKKAVADDKKAVADDKKKADADKKKAADDKKKAADDKKKAADDKKKADADAKKKAADDKKKGKDEKVAKKDEKKDEKKADDGKKKKWAGHWRGYFGWGFISIRQFCPEVGTVMIDGRKAWMEGQKPTEMDAGEKTGKKGKHYRSRNWEGGPSFRMDERNQYYVATVRAGHHKIEVKYDSGRPSEVRRAHVMNRDTTFATIVCTGEWDNKDGKRNNKKIVQ